MNRSRRFAVGSGSHVASTLTIVGWLIFAFTTSTCSKETPPPAPAAAPAPAAPPPAPVKGPLRIGFSDWPGWTAFQIGIDWFEYAPSMDAFAAGKVDAVMMTMGDALVTGAPGPRSLAILVTDYSSGNDMIVAKRGIKDIKGLKGKKIGLEVGLVEHLMLDKALEKSGMKESDVKLINIPTHQTAQSLGTGDVDAIGAWQPNAGQALKASAGSKAVFTSKDVPGLIYDLVCVSPKSLADRRDDWVKVVKVWNKIVAFVLDPANKDEAVKIMAGRAGVPPAEYATYLPGTHFLKPEEALTRFTPTDKLDSLLGSGKVADAFNVANKVYAKSQDVASYIDGSLSKDALAK
jgi:NitT/TauT family transport system substrate-binding protein